MACANGGCFDIQESSETTYSSNRKFSPVAELYATCSSTQFTT